MANSSNNSNNKTAAPSFSFEPAEVSTISTEVNNYVNATVNGLLNKVYYAPGGSGTDTSQNFSAIAGPRGSFTTLTMEVNPDIPDDHYQVYGKTGQTQGGSTTYDYIDTNIYGTKRPRLYIQANTTLTVDNKSTFRVVSGKVYNYGLIDNSGTILNNAHLINNKEIRNQNIFIHTSKIRQLRKILIKYKIICNKS